MRSWSMTHGARRGAYLRAGPNELYVRQDEDPRLWFWFVDGHRGGVAAGEPLAKAAAEAACRAMSRTHTAAMAAPARKAG